MLVHNDDDRDMWEMSQTAALPSHWCHHWTDIDEERRTKMMPTMVIVKRMSKGPMKKA